MKRRVVITGMGAITPLGIGIERNWQALCKGKSGIGLISRFDTSNFRTRIAGEVKDFTPLDFIDRKQVHRSSRFIQFALAASRLALEDARLTIDSNNGERTGVSVGTAMGGVESGERGEKLLLDGAKEQISPFFIPNLICNMAAGHVSIQFGAKGPNMCSVTACASGTHAIGDAFRAIQWGEADIMIAGGTEATISPIIFAGLDVMRAMSARNSEPEKASRPFDKDRDGFVISEGAAIVILEELESARKRGARVYAEVVGYGHNSDAYHLTAPEPSGEGAANCMSMAIRDAGLQPENIDHINAHGTSTVLNDAAETKAIKRVFGERARTIPITANKSMTGHLWAASGALETIFSALTIMNGIIPPTINLENPDPGCDLDYVPIVARKAEVNVVLSNSFGFGSTNGVLILRKLA